MWAAFTKPDKCSGLFCTKGSGEIETGRRRKKVQNQAKFVRMVSCNYEKIMLYYIFNLRPKQQAAAAGFIKLL
jgi:hypothetical protein